MDYLHRKCQIIHTDMKPENVLMCVEENHVRHLANEAIEWQKLGIKPNGSAVATVESAATKLASATTQEQISAISENQQATIQTITITGEQKITRNRKKKLRKKQKRIQTLIETQEKQIELLQKENFNLLGGSDSTTIDHLLSQSTHIDASQIEDKRLSKLISIVQDLNIESIMQNAQQTTAQETTTIPETTSTSNKPDNVNNHDKNSSDDQKKTTVESTKEKLDDLKENETKTSNKEVNGANNNDKNGVKGNECKVNGGNQQTKTRRNKKRRQNRAQKLAAAKAAAEGNNDDNKQQQGNQIDKSKIYSYLKYIFFLKKSITYTIINRKRQQRSGKTSNNKRRASNRE